MVYNTYICLTLNRHDNQSQDSRRPLSEAYHKDGGGQHFHETSLDQTSDSNIYRAKCLRDPAKETPEQVAHGWVALRPYCHRRRRRRSSLWLEDHQNRRLKRFFLLLIFRR